MERLDLDQFQPTTLSVAAINLSQPTEQNIFHGLSIYRNFMIYFKLITFV